MILINNTTEDATYTITGGSGTPPSGTLGGSCQIVISLSDNFTYQVTFNVNSQQVSSNPNLIACSTVSLNMSGGVASVSTSTMTIALVSDGTTTGEGLGNSRLVTLNVEDVDTFTLAIETEHISGPSHSDAIFDHSPQTHRTVIHVKDGALVNVHQDPTA